MCTGLDAISQRASTNKTVDIANRILIVRHLAAITKEQLPSAVPEAMILIPSIAASLPVFSSNHVALI
jgi:hypothetical protein